MTIKYRGYRIDHVYPPIPIRKFDWAFEHEDYDGADDSEDDRCGHAESIEACKAEIDEQILDFEIYQKYLDEKEKKNV